MKRLKGLPREKYFQPKSIGTNGGEAPVELGELDAALKRRSSTALHVFVISA